MNGKNGFEIQYCFRPDPLNLKLCRHPLYFGDTKSHFRKSHPGKVTPEDSPLGKLAYMYIRKPTPGNFTPKPFYKNWETAHLVGSVASTKLILVF